jgi:predicted nucleotidyltransferase
MEIIRTRVLESTSASVFNRPRHAHAALATESDIDRVIGFGSPRRGSVGPSHHSDLCLMVRLQAHTLLSSCVRKMCSPRAVRALSVSLFVSAFVRVFVTVSVEGWRVRMLARKATETASANFD